MRMILAIRSPSAGRRWALPLLLGILGAAGCSVSADRIVRECKNELSYSGYLDQIVGATISYEKRCGVLDPAGSRDAQRKTLFLASYPGFLTEIRNKAATEKRTGYDASCFVNLLKDGVCSTDGVVRAIQACAGTEAFGCLEAGRLCQLPEECKLGFCRGIAATSLCGGGSCAAWGGIGAGCPEGNIACDPFVAYCKNGACQPLEDENVDCEANNQCKAGLSCVRADGGAVVGKCGKPRVGQEGEVCNLLGKVGQSCGAGLSCYKDAGGIYKCQKPVPLDLPMSCKTSEACDGAATCVRDKSTDDMGTCKKLGASGTECSTDPLIGAACQTTLSCFTFDPMLPASCQPRPENTQRCVLPELDCLTGVCDTTSPEARCRAKTGAGLACANNSDCASGQCNGTTKKCQEPVCK